MLKDRVFAFERNISATVLWALETNNKMCIKSTEDDIVNSIEALLSDRPSYIIGLGEYTGKDRDRIRIETACTNKFRNIVRGMEYKETRISEFLKPALHSKLAKGIGNSYCNLISHYISDRIKALNGQTRYGFIHIPEGFSVDTAANEINHILKSLI